MCQRIFFFPTFEVTCADRISGIKSLSKKQDIERCPIVSILSFCKMLSPGSQDPRRITGRPALEPELCHSKSASLLCLIPVSQSTEPDINSLLVNENNGCKQRNL